MIPPTSDTRENTNDGTHFGDPTESQIGHAVADFGGQIAPGRRVITNAVGDCTGPQFVTGRDETGQSLADSGGHAQHVRDGRFFLVDCRVCRAELRAMTDRRRLAAYRSPRLESGRRDPDSYSYRSVDGR